MEIQLVIQFKIAITAIIQIIGNLYYSPIRMSIKLDGTLFKFEACLYNTMRAFEFFKLKINKLPRLNEVARKYCVSYDHQQFFEASLMSVRREKTAQIEYLKRYTISFWHLCLIIIIITKMIVIIFRN